MSGHLYQLKLGKAVGDLVRIDGPWDTWGRVLSLKNSDFHLIRGLGHQKPQETFHG